VAEVEPSRRERKAVERRLAILRAAAGVFRDRGYGSASMDEIAERLDMAKGNLYYYFSNKHELLFFCQDYSLDTLIAGVDEIAASDLDVVERVRRAIVSHVVCVLDELDGASAHTEVHALPDDLRGRVIAKRDLYEARFRALIENGISAGAFAPVDAKLAALAILGALNASTRWYKPGGERSPHAIGEHFAALFLDGLRIAAPASPNLRRIR
jgi:AcrR family transcriptional regulator